MATQVTAPLVLSNQGSLATVEIAIFGLAFLISSISIVHHGSPLSRLGLAFVTSACIIHFVGSACYLSYEQGGGGESYRVVYAVTTFIGAAPLLSAALAFLELARNQNGGAESIIVHSLQLLPITGLVLGIAGGVEYSHATSGDQRSGQQLLQAASLIFIVTAAAVIALTTVNLYNHRSLRTLAIAVSMPFLVIRLIYDILIAFAGDDTDYAFDLPSMIVQILMRLIMEYAVVLLYLFTGLGAAPTGTVESGDETDQSDDKMHELQPISGLSEPARAKVD